MCLCTSLSLWIKLFSRNLPLDTQRPLFLHVHVLLVMTAELSCTWFYCYCNRHCAMLCDVISTHQCIAGIETCSPVFFCCLYLISLSHVYILSMSSWPWRISWSSLWFIVTDTSSLWKATVWTSSPVKHPIQLFLFEGNDNYSCCLSFLFYIYVYISNYTLWNRQWY